MTNYKTLTVEGTDSASSSKESYELEVTGDLQSVDTNPADNINGNIASGLINAGRDIYRYTGEFVKADLPSHASVETGVSGTYKTGEKTTNETLQTRIEENVSESDPSEYTSPDVVEDISGSDGSSPVGGNSPSGGNSQGGGLGMGPLAAIAGVVLAVVIGVGS